jgi:hypothetical protein
VSDEEKERYTAEEQKQKTDADKQTATATASASKDALVKAGFTDAIATSLSTLGFKLGTSLTIPSTLNPNISTLASDYITEKGGFIFDTPNGQAVLDKNGVPIPESGENFDQFNPLHGLA